MEDGDGSGPAEVPALLREAHAAVAAGEPARALRLVLTALQALGGDAAAAPALNRVLSHLTEQQGPGSGSSTAGAPHVALQELSDLFNSLTLATNGGAPAGPWGGVLAPPQPAHASGLGGGEGGSMSAGVAGGWRAGEGGTCAAGQGQPGGWGGGGCGGGMQLQQPQQPHALILGETGREGFVECAISDGSSYACPRCGDVVLATRRAQHEAFWCSAGGTSGEDGDGGGAGTEADMEEG